MEVELVCCVQSGMRSVFTYLMRLYYDENSRREKLSGQFSRFIIRRAYETFDVTDIEFNISITDSTFFRDFIMFLGRARWEFHLFLFIEISSLKV